MTDRVRAMMADTCKYMYLYVKNHPNAHGPGMLREGRIVPTHDAASHQRELDFWSARLARYQDAA
jgi:hypothetical protein